MKPRPRAGLVQMTSGPDPEANLAQLNSLLVDLRDEQPDMVFAPENALVLGGPEEYRAVAEELGEGPVQAAAAALAKEHSVWLSIGSFPIRATDDRLHATTLVYDSTGELQAHYEKLHLFDVSVAGDRESGDFTYRESDAIAPGELEVVVDTPLGTLGLTICYDLRFPPLYQRLRRLGAEVLAVPAAFTAVTGEAHWETLIRARAIETQCFVLAPGQVGSHPDGRTTWGHSMAVDPWGRVLAACGSEQGSVVVGLDREELRGVRSRMPILEHQRE